jgi:glutaredoxin
MSEPAHRPSHNHRVFLVLLIAILVFGSTATGGAADASNMDSFAKCLAAQKTTMYGSFLCPHCDDQKKLFDGSFKYVPYVECAIPGSRRLTFTCQMAQIQFTPTWIFADGERRTGVQSLQQLSTKTGCRLP